MPSNSAPKIERRPILQTETETLVNKNGLCSSELGPNSPMAKYVTLWNKEKPNTASQKKKSEKKNRKTAKRHFPIQQKPLPPPNTLSPPPRNSTENDETHQKILHAKVHCDAIGAIRSPIARIVCEFGSKEEKKKKEDEEEWEQQRKEARRRKRPEGFPSGQTGRPGQLVLYCPLPRALEQLFCWAESDGWACPVGTLHHYTGLS